MRISDADSSVHSIGYILNQESLIDKLKHYHPQIDYCHNLSYYCFGHGRCFKNIKNFKFDVNTFNDVCEDSYRMLYMNGYGNWLHIPRNLYTWTIRNDSISSIKNSNHNLTYNKNFDIGLEKTKSSNYESVYSYNSSYKELNSIMFFDINTLNNNLCIISPRLNKKQENEIKEVYIDKNIEFNKYSGFDQYAIVLNYFESEDGLCEILDKLKSLNNKMHIKMYYLNENIHPNISSRDVFMNEKLNKFLSSINKYFSNVSYYSYFRHLIFTVIN
jgi:hypothetical protein